VRQATGIPVYVLAKRLGVTKHEVFRLETAESSSRIMLANLKRAAEALGCDLVYGLVPRKGSLKELAAAEVSMREAARELVEEKRAEQANAADEWTDIHGTIRRAMRRQLRKQGLRFW
jgi:transcriptional regulator with XRE-family HTH domain